MKKINCILMFVLGIVLCAGCADTAEPEERRSASKLPAISVEPSEEPEEKEESVEEPIALSDDEKKLFTDFIRERENYGFVLSEYDVPEKVDLSEVLYSGAGFGEPIPEEEIPLYLEATRNEFMDTDCLKFPQKSIDEFLQRKLGIRFDDLQRPFEWTYLSDTDSYYNMAGDTNYVLLSCEEGSRKGDTYTLRFVPEDDWYPVFFSTETVVEETNDGYHFISNHILMEE